MQVPCISQKPGDAGCMVDCYGTTPFTTINDQYRTNLATCKIFRKNPRQPGYPRSAVRIHPMRLQTRQHFPPTPGGLPYPVFNRQKALLTLLIDANHHQRTACLVAPSRRCKSHPPIGTPADPDPEGTAAMPRIQPPNRVSGAIPCWPTAPWPEASTIPPASQPSHRLHLCVTNKVG